MLQMVQTNWDGDMDFILVLAHEGRPGGKAHCETARQCNEGTSSVVAFICTYFHVDFMISCMVNYWSSCGECRPNCYVS